MCSFAAHSVYSTLTCDVCIASMFVPTPFFAKMNSIEVFILEMSVLMASHCDNYETLFGWLEMMRSQETNKALLHKLSLMQNALDRLPNKTIPLFQELAADATLDYEQQFSSRMNAFMDQVARAPRSESLFEHNMELVEEMYRELETQCTKALCIVRDVAELRFNYEQGDEDFPNSIDELYERA